MVDEEKTKCASATEKATHERDEARAERDRAARLRDEANAQCQRAVRSQLEIKMKVPTRFQCSRIVTITSALAICSNSQIIDSKIAKRARYLILDRRASRLFVSYSDS